MTTASIAPENTEFVILSFEGPDLYSLAGGLGVRVSNLSEALADRGFRTHLFYVGDPKLKGEETRKNGNLVLHRWCQWLSEFYPRGVYEGEADKVRDYYESIPAYVRDRVVRQATAHERAVVILGEEWHTAGTMCRLSEVLSEARLRNNAVMLWNANNTFGFERIDWRRLNRSVTLTTVSRYMKQIMRGMGLNPLVIPNGIPSSLLNGVDERQASRLRSLFSADIMLTKVARWDPDKCWLMAIEALARLKARGAKPVLLARGGIEAHGEAVLQRAESLGLIVRDAVATGSSVDEHMNAMAACSDADMVNIRFHCPQELLRIMYHASDAVLANSVHEPFGLVGLEAMAAGGVAFTGGTGEDYALPFYNAIVLETRDAAEIETYVLYLATNPLEADKLRRAGRQTAALYTWDEVLKNLCQRIEFQARRQGLLDSVAVVRDASKERPIRDSKAEPQATSRT